MLRSILRIDRDLCNGCGQCVMACAEGAIEMRDGKALVVKEEFCDGLGACIGECPTGALVIEERDVPAFDPGAVALHLQRLGRSSASASSSQDATLPPRVQPSDLGHWPVQLHLVPIRAPFFQDGRELVVLSTCAPVASADVHWRFLRGRSVVVACPKLDRTDPYVEKLAAIFASNPIPRVIVVRMEVPCCGGLVRFVLDARSRCGRSDFAVDEVVVGTGGDVLDTRRLAG